MQKEVCLICGYIQDVAKHRCNWCGDKFNLATIENYIAQQSLSGSADATRKLCGTCKSFTGGIFMKTKLDRAIRSLSKAIQYQFAGMTYTSNHLDNLQMISHYQGVILKYMSKRRFDKYYEKIKNEAYAQMSSNVIFIKNKMEQKYNDLTTANMWLRFFRKISAQIANATSHIRERCVK